MGIINPQIPSLNSPTETEDPKIVDALTTIRDEINGGLDDTNVANNADINGSKLLDGSVDEGKITGVIPISKVATPIDASKIEAEVKAATATDTQVLGGTTVDISGLSFSLDPGRWLVIASVILGAGATAEGFLNLVIGGSGVVNKQFEQQAGSTVETTIIYTPTIASTSTVKARLVVAAGFGTWALAGSTLTAVRLGA